MAFCCVACEESLPSYGTGWRGVQFVLNESSLNPNVYSYSFVGKEDNLIQDTVWLTVRPQGLLPEKSSRIKLEQYEGQEWIYVYGNDGLVTDSILRVIPRQAEAGVHYISFDDERMAKYLMAGDEAHSNITLRIADCISRPSAWDNWFFAGAWSRVRHEFMIRVTGKEWDNTFITSLTKDDRNYYLYVFNRELKIENAKRAEQGLPPLRENPDDPNTDLVFPTVAYW